MSETNSSVQNLNRNDIVKTIGILKEQTYFNCRYWFNQLEHFQLSAVKGMKNDRLAIFNKCLEGGMSVWWQDLGMDFQEDWELTRGAFLEEFVGRA